MYDEEKGGDLHEYDPIGWALAVLSNGRRIAVARSSREVASADKYKELIKRFDRCIKEIEAYKAAGHNKLDDTVYKILREAFEGVDHRFDEGAHSPRLIV